MMRNMEFHDDTERQNISIRQQALRNRTIARYKTFARRCEHLKLHALAAHAYRILLHLDPDHHKQHLGHYIYNAREAGFRGMSLLLTQSYN